MKSKERIKERLDKTKETEDFFERVLLSFVYEFCDKGVEQGLKKHVEEFKQDLRRGIKDPQTEQIAKKVVELYEWVLDVQ